MRDWITRSSMREPRPSSPNSQCPSSTLRPVNISRYTWTSGKGKKTQVVGRCSLLLLNESDLEIHKS